MRSRTANGAVSIGGGPAEFSPSVMRMMTLLRSLLFLRKVVLAWIAQPMPVPVASSASRIAFMAHSWSSVSGLTSQGVRAKHTMPMRSSARPLMKSVVTWTNASLRLTRRPVRRKSVSAIDRE